MISPVKRQYDLQCGKRGAFCETFFGLPIVGLGEATVAAGFVSRFLTRPSCFCHQPPATLVQSIWSSSELEVIRDARIRVGVVCIFLRSRAGGAAGAIRYD